ncbi:hypothetical protein [Emticicia sp. 21SJ11W-3]|uniref:hypothetical protein n=1 Tax=Emticicia sp. 21SJ11W-3 TaxID=2916755 RepID=UPI00209E224F|nr:hypothetical protein [Emticicia sp. 21SJ11W-3]UTA69574.1 hypothetical protein MB380_07120 [Emticicia sp. 21SJ11W-3]
MKIVKAASIDNVARAFLGTPLSVEDLDLYLETDNARGGTPFRKRIYRQLESINDLPCHVLFVGYKGCGKSTELNKLKQDIIDKGDKYLVLHYSVFKELDPENINYIELFIVTMEKLFDVVVENGLELNEDYLERIRLWETSTEITRVKDKYFGAEFEAGADSSFGIPYIQKFFAKLKATAKASRSFKEVLKNEIEPRLADLIENCNLLINEIRLQLHKINKDNLLIIVEDLDKVSLESSKDLFVNHAGQITQLEVNIIFTFPIALYYSSYFNHIKPFFAERYELPMIKVKEKTGEESANGITTLISIVEKRMDLNIFENQSILKDMILMSGGCLRDLFLLIREAANFAIDEEREKIREGDYQKSLQNLIQDYQNNLTDEKIEGQYFPVEKIYDELLKLVETGQFENTLLMLKLRQTLCVLGYNGEFWGAVHPVVRKILERKGLL